MYGMLALLPHDDFELPRIEFFLDLVQHDSGEQASPGEFRPNVLLFIAAASS